ncbi:MAG TPA: fused MFS/spermidine synthase [Bryobacteraceae bacterium]|nr:fused MFS/spermidine synthase [Bryobacteraceae bacterium]
MKTSRSLPLLLLLFAGSGCSALIYEIVWYQLLQLAIGSTAVSLGVLLATFMGGLCIGSIGLPRMRLAGRHPLRVYAALEAGIGLFGILVLIGIPFIDRVYIAGVGHGLPGMLLRGLIAAVCLLPPTVLMGASLPAIVRWVDRSPRGVSWWGLLYGGNTAGAVFGCLLAGFYLLRTYDVEIATSVAAAINFAVAAISYALAARAPAGAAAEETGDAVAQTTTGSSGPSWTIYSAIALSGTCALGAEVVWTRLMGMMLGATVYVFSIILAVFLIGLALGSAAASWLLRWVKPRLALGWCQILLALGIAWTAYAIAQSLPHWPALLYTTPWRTLELDMARCLWAILPPALLWGASFPLAFAAAAPFGKEPGRLVGGIYAANTLGAIAGALTVSLALIPWIGTLQSQRVLLALSALSGVIVLAPYVWRNRAAALAAGLAASIALAGALAWKMHPIPGELIAYGRRVATAIGSANILYTAEGRNSSIAISISQDGSLEVDVNGHVEATTEPFDMKLQRMVGHLPALLHPNPHSVLGIGFGAGVSAGTFTRYPGIQKITICEIEPVIPPTSTRYFGKENYNVMHDPRTRIIYDDARHYVLTTTEKFDIIASDPLDVFVKGTAALYSKEYFDVVKQHLNPGGMFTLYVPLYESDTATVKSELATFFEAFPHGTIWANTRLGEGYDMVFLGQADPLKINLDEVERRFRRPDYARVAESLQDVGVYSPRELLATYAGRRSDLSAWIQGAQLNRDKDLRLQYLAGWGINSQLEAELYRQIVSYVRVPTDLFEGSPALVQRLLADLGAMSNGGTQP